MPCVRMFEQFNEFNVVLLSNGSKGFYGNENTQSRFANVMPKIIALEPQKWSVGVSEIFCNKFEVDCSEKICDKKQREFEFLYIHIDVISSQVVGGQQAQVIKVVPVFPNEKHYIKFGHIEYAPVIENNIYEIKAEVLNQEQKPIKFETSHLPTMIKLHFKKIK